MSGFGPTSGLSSVWARLSGRHPRSEPVNGNVNAARPQGIPQRPIRQTFAPHHRLSGGIDFSTFNDDDELARNTAPASTQPEPDVSGAGPLTITTRVEYAALPRNQAQDVFGLVTVQTDPSAMALQQEDKRQPMDIICVLDVSGSMTGAKIEQVKEAVRFVINESEPTDRVSIVTFQSVAQRELRLRRMDAHGKDEAHRAVLPISAGGGTRIASGMEIAVEIAERRKQKNSVSAIFLLTDGHDGGAYRDVPPLISRARSAGCSVYPFGFGSDHDAKLLSEIAENAETPFTFVEDVGFIKEAFAGAMGGLSSVIAQDVKVVIESSVTLKKVHTAFTSHQEGNRVVINIPDMLAGERRDILVEVSIPSEAPAEEHFKVLSASAQYFSLVSGVPAQTALAEMTMSRCDEQEPAEEMEPDTEVTTQRHRVEVAQALTAAVEHGDAGRFDEAQALLDAQASQLKKRKVQNATTDGLVLELEDARNRMKSHSIWEMSGRAELRDASAMHMKQRATNAYSSATCTNAKMSKQMYVTSVQSAWMSKASPSPSGTGGASGSGGQS